MCWRRFASLVELRLLAASLVVLSCVAAAKADVVVERDRTVFGKITKINKRAVTIKPECASSPEVIPRDRVRQVLFDSECKTHTVEEVAIAEVDCGAEGVPLYSVSFAGQKGVTYIEEADFEGDKVKLELPDWGVLKGPSAQVKSLTPVRICPAQYMALTSTFASPASFRFFSPGAISTSTAGGVP